MSTRGSVSDSRAVLLKAVRDAVHSNYKHLELFVTVLRKFSETAHIGDTIFEEYSQYFKRDNTVEEMEAYLTERRSSRDTTCTESGSSCESTKEEVKEIQASHKILFPRSMEDKFQELRIKFGSTFFQVRRNFAKNHKLSIDEIKLLLIDCFPDLSSQIYHKKTINEVLDVVKRKCSIINVRPLEVLTVEFNVEEAEKIINIYKKFVKNFCKSMSIQLCLDKELQAVPTPFRLKKETVIFILEWNPDESTLQDINDVLEKLEPLENYHIQIDAIKTGHSVVVTCYCPVEYTGSLIMAVLDKIEILQRRGLKEFAAGKHTVWINTAHKVIAAVTSETFKEIDKVTKKTVNDYEDMKKELLSMKQQLGNQMHEIQLKLQSKQDKGQAHKLQAAESIDEFRETQYAISRRKTIEIATMKQKDETFGTEKELASWKELSEKRLHEIQQLKLKLEDKNKLRLPVADLSKDELSVNYSSKIGEVVRYRGDVIVLKAKIQKLEDIILDLNGTRQSLEKELYCKNQEIAALKSISFFELKEPEKELVETRMLYTCTLDDIEVLGVISKGHLGDDRSMMVVRAQCIKQGLPYPDRVYALKILFGIHLCSTMTYARDQHKNEYEVLSSIPPHKNIVRLFAFFYDRPKTHPKLNRENCGEGIALCIMMEQLSQNMETQIKPLRQTTGPNSITVLRWFKDLLTGLQYLYIHYILHRDLKLENLMLSGNILKIVDFGEAINLEPDYKIPFDRPCSKGGNEVHLAPEIINQRTGRGRVLDYTKQPVWAAGVLAYELAGHQNPFSASKDQRAYDERTLMRLTETYSRTSRGQRFPAEFPNIVERMLSFEPARRPTLSDTLDKISKLI